MSIAEEIPFSQLIQHSRETLDKLESTRGRRLRLVRRDGEDLVLESAERAEAGEQAAIAAARIFAEMLRTDEPAVLRSLPAAFPWMRFLPAPAARDFAAEFAEIALAAADMGNMAPVVPVVDAWRATAEIHADPALRKALTTALDGSDHGRATEPEAPAG
ncbi:MAG: hypothetical protein ACRDOK_01505 [Streptosporangiaceae bacterium]